MKHKAKKSCCFFLLQLECCGDLINLQSDSELQIRGGIEENSKVIFFISE